MIYVGSVLRNCCLSRCSSAHVHLIFKTAAVQPSPKLCLLWPGPKLRKRCGTGEGANVCPCPRAVSASILHYQLHQSFWKRMRTLPRCDTRSSSRPAQAAGCRARPAAASPPGPHATLKGPQRRRQSAASHHLALRLSHSLHAAHRTDWHYKRRFCANFRLHSWHARRAMWLYVACN